VTSASELVSTQLEVVHDVGDCVGALIFGVSDRKHKRTHILVSLPSVADKELR
jgi:hypothetical protein